MFALFATQTNYFNTRVCREPILVEEFLKVETPKVATMSVSNNPINATKNRYNSVLPIENTRVILSKNEMEGSDYINANHVDGVAPNSKKYIACQAPLSNTCSDFWRMIWEQNCAVIIMLTPLEEGNMVKATKYWPDEGKVVRFGSLQVCHKKSFQVGDLIVRSILIKDLTPESKNSIREIIQVHYEAWPDFGAPKTTKPIRDIIILMHKFQERAQTLYSLNGPFVVHCSAGVGRTGCLIAAAIALDQIKLNLVPNIKDIVETLRKQRHPTTVKNEIQYSLIYSVIKDVLKERQCLKSSS